LHNDGSKTAGMLLSLYSTYNDKDHTTIDLHAIVVTPDCSIMRSAFTETKLD